MSLRNVQKLLVGSAGTILVSLFFIVPFSATNAEPQLGRTGNKVLHEMTVLEVDAPRKGSAFYMVSFQVSQRHYKLLKKDASRYLRLLRASEKTHKPVLVERPSEESDTITAVRRITRK